jgi:uncharacterized protein YrrD
MTLRSMTEVSGFAIGATDGAIGKVKDLYFDDERWTVRYLVADVGHWLAGRSVLISPHAVVRIDSNDETVDTQLTRSQVENSPSIDTDRPISRRMENEYNRYYGYPPYWPGSSAAALWGFAALPLAGLRPIESARAREPAPAPTEPDNVHLRSGQEVMGYQVAATDDKIGHVENFLFEEDSWAIRFLVVDTRDWWPGRHVLVSTAEVERVSWGERSVHLRIARAEVERSPEHEPRSTRESRVRFRL